MKITQRFVVGWMVALMLAPFSVLAQTAYSPATAKSVDSSIIHELEGRWRNDFLPSAKASTLYIRKIDQSTGQITGTYSSPIGGGVKEFPVVGWVNTAPPQAGSDHVVVLSFTVNWGDFGTITAWNGYYTLPEGADKPLIVGQWLLSQPNSDFPWGHVLAGQDRYHKFAEN